MAKGSGRASERLERLVLVLFVGALLSATILNYRATTLDLANKRAGIAQEIGFSLDLTSKGIDFLLSAHVVPAALRSGERAKADAVIGSFLKEGAELSLVAVTRADGSVFTTLSPAEAVDAGADLDALRALPVAARMPGGAVLRFMPPSPGRAERLVIEQAISDGGRLQGSLLAQVDLSRILRRIEKETEYPLPVRLTSVRESERHVTAEVDSPLSPSVVLAETFERRSGVLLLVILALAALYLLSRLLVAKAIFPFEFLVDKLDAVIKGDRSPIDPERYAFFFRPFVAGINRLISEVIETQDRQRKLMESAALKETASQVAHDIRSPLAALDALSGSVSGLPEQDRLLLRRAIDRIKDIANNLIEEARSELAPGGAEPSAGVHLLTSLVEPVVTEKRLQRRATSAVDLVAPSGPESYGLFARVEPTTLKRVASNLIDNAFDALDGRGRVTVTIAPDGEARVAIRVEDDGRGIAPDVLSRLGRKGETHGKAGGLGLGLYHARAQAEAWGGSLVLASAPGRGTTASIILPRARPPAWFVPRLEIPSGRVIVLDDDESIHQIWRGRLEPLAARLEDFYSPEALRARLSASPLDAEESLFLVDHELLNDAESGLDLIESLGIASRSVLVTSRSDEEAVLARCVRLGLRLIPKSSAGFVPVVAASTQARLDCALIDDDELVHQTWKRAARVAGRKIETFATPEDFFARASSIDRETPVYVDVLLAGGVDGAEVARKVFEAGFRSVFLATGKDARDVAPLEFVKGVGDKTPPF